MSNFPGAVTAIVIVDIAALICIAFDSYIFHTDDYTSECRVGSILSIVGAILTFLIYSIMVPLHIFRTVGLVIGVPAFVFSLIGLIFKINCAHHDPGATDLQHDFVYYTLSFCAANLLLVIIAAVLGQ